MEHQKLWIRWRRIISLKKTIYFQQPLGFEDPSLRNHVCQLNKSLHGLKDAPCAWFKHFSLHLQTIGYAPFFLRFFYFCLSH
jgi:hypothetical protein